MALNQRINTMLGKSALDVVSNAPVFPSFARVRPSGADSSPTPIVDATNAGVAASVNFGGGAIEGKLSAAFLGAMVVAIVAFNIVTRGVQL